MSERVLVFLVDDDVLIQPTLQESLEDGGYAVETASSAEEAMTQLEARGAAFKALVTDINLGSKLTGWDVAKRAREMLPGIPVVYMTGYAGNDWTAYGVPNSILLEKPFAPVQLLVAVSQSLNASVMGGQAAPAPQRAS